MELSTKTITAPSIDILYYQILRKWQQFILRSTSSGKEKFCFSSAILWRISLLFFHHEGLPFSAFVEAFFLLSQRKFPSAPSLLDSVDHLLHHCNRHLNSTLPSNNLNNSFQLQRSSARTTSVSLNIRPPSNLAPQRSILVSSTANSNSRSRLLPQTTPAAAQTATINNNNNNNNDVVAAASIDNKLKQSTKSVFSTLFRCFIRLNMRESIIINNNNEKTEEKKEDEEESTAHKKLKREIFHSYCTMRSSASLQLNFDDRFCSFLT